MASIRRSPVPWPSVSSGGTVCTCQSPRLQECHSLPPDPTAWGNETEEMDLAELTLETLPAVSTVCPRTWGGKHLCPQVQATGGLRGQRGEEGGGGRPATAQARPCPVDLPGGLEGDALEPRTEPSAWSRALVPWESCPGALRTGQWGPAVHVDRGLALLGPCAPEEEDRPVLSEVLVSCPWALGGLPVDSCDGTPRTGCQVQTEPPPVLSMVAHSGRGCPQAALGCRSVRT